MDILTFIIDYFFIEPLLGPWDLAKKIEFVTISIVIVLLSIDLILNQREKKIQESKVKNKLTLNKI